MPEFINKLFCCLPMGTKLISPPGPMGKELFSCLPMGPKALSEHIFM